MWATEHQAPLPIHVRYVRRSLNAEGEHGPGWAIATTATGAVVTTASASPAAAIPLARPSAVAVAVASQALLSVAFLPGRGAQRVLGAATTWRWLRWAAVEAFDREPVLLREPCAPRQP